MRAAYGKPTASPSPTPPPTEPTAHRPAHAFRRPAPAPERAQKPSEMPQAAPGHRGVASFRLLDLPPKGEREKRVEGEGDDKNSIKQRSQNLQLPGPVTFRFLSVNEAKG